MCARRNRGICREGSAVNQTSILIADDHALLRRGLATLLDYHKPFKVVGGAKNGEEAVRLADRLTPDVVIMDLSMPVMDGVEATRRIHEAHPEVKILILTTFGTSVDVARAVRAGASGAVVKDCDEGELLRAIRTIVSGGTFFSQEVGAMIAKEPEPPHLTERQREILAELVNGRTSDAIAAKLGISADAVNQHVNAIRLKLNAANRTEAVTIALRKQLLKM